MSAVQPAIRGAKRDIVAIEARRDGVVIVRLEADTAHCGPMTPGFGAELAAAMDRIEQDAGVAAAVLAVGDLDGGTLGADVELFKAIQFATDAERLARNAAHVLSRVQRLKKPIVAAVHGAALGGIFELALACHALVASDDERTVLGFPEAT